MVLRALSLSCVAFGCTVTTPLDELTRGDGGPVTDSASDAVAACDGPTSVDNCCGVQCQTRANSVPSCTSGACVNTCNPGFANCDGDESNGCETPIREDVKNCGRCKRDCVGGTCTNGDCSSVTIAMTSTTGSEGIAVDAKNVYWVGYDGASERGWTCPIAGCAGPPMQWLANNSGVYAVTVDAQALFISGSKAVLACPLVGSCSNATTVSGPVNGGSSYAGALVDDGASLLWDNGKAVRIVAKDGSNAVVVADNGMPQFLAGLQGVTADAANVYFLSQSNNGMYGVWRCPRAGCGSSPAKIGGTTNASGRALVAFGGELHWLVVAGASTSLATCPLPDCTNPKAVPIPGGASPYAIVADSSGVYWTDEQAGTISGCAPGCPKILTLASAQSAPRGIAIDSQAIYWTNRDDGSVRKIAKP